MALQRSVEIDNCGNDERFLWVNADTSKKDYQGLATSNNGKPLCPRMHTLIESKVLGTDPEDNKLVIVKLACHNTNCDKYCPNQER